MQFWFKMWQDNHLLSDITIDRLEDDTRTHKIFHALDEACLAFDLGHPIWLDKNVSELKRSGKTRFSQDNFVEEVPFDYVELHILEED